MSDNLTLADLVSRSREQAANAFRVGMPVRVVGYDASRSMVQVQIVLPHIDEAGNETPQPIINEVPVMWPRSGGAFITFPINIGDTGYCHFADFDIGAWVSDGDAVLDSKRQHHLSDAVFVPGLQAGGIAANPSAVEIAYNSTFIRLNQDGTVLIDAPTVTITGEVIAQDAVIGGIRFSTHKHGGVQTGNGTTGNPQ